MAANTDRPTPTLRRILRTPEAAQYLGLSEVQLEKWRLTGAGPKFVRLGGRSVGYTIEALNNWVAQQEKNT